MQYAFCDEYGAYGYSFEKENVSTHFLISAIIINEEDLETVKTGAEQIRRKFFQTGEMKSSKIKNHKRRRLILNELKQLPFNIYLFVADKRKIYDESGLRNKQSFYKFLNQYVYRELHIGFEKLTIVADETGHNEFMTSFSKYVRNRNTDLTLFDEFNFQFNKSNHSVLIQIADIISGSLAFSFDEKKKEKAEGSNYKSFLRSKILGIEEFPKNYANFSVRDQMPNDSVVNQKIAEICFRKAISFKKSNETNNTDIYIRMQIAVLNHLLFRFMNNSIRTYIPTIELINTLERKGFEHLSIPAFRNKIIARLRDHGVIISSCSKGYKIPSKRQEVEDFVEHSENIIEPMLSRLKLCYDAINLGSNGSIDIFEAPQFKHIKELLNINSDKTNNTKE